MNKPLKESKILSYLIGSREKRFTGVHFNKNTT